jgi:hypothetical protein
MKATNIVYKLVIGYVDNSYWDDGSRWTSKTVSFTNRSDAMAAIESLKKHKIVEDYGQGGGGLQNFRAHWARLDVISTASQDIKLDT